MLKIGFYYFKNNRKNPKVRLLFEQKFQIKMIHWLLLIEVLDKRIKLHISMCLNIFNLAR